MIFVIIEQPYFIVETEDVNLIESDTDTVPPPHV